MTIQPPSRATLADILKAIDDAPDITGRRKQDLRSAVRLVAKTIGQEPQTIMADPRGLGRRLDGVSALSLGLSAGRWANSKSLLRSALRLVRPTMAGASSFPLLGEWEHLAKEARKVGSHWLRLCRLLRWLSAKRIGPSVVTLIDLENYRAEFLSDALLGNPEQSWHATRRAWERMRETCPEWPQIVLRKAPNPKVYSLPWEAFPASLKVEVDLLLERLAGNDLSDDGPPRPLRPATLRNRAHELHSFASALVHQGLEPATLTSLAVCLSTENIKLGLKWFYERHGFKPSRTMHNLAANLKAVARHWVKADEATLEAMARTVRRLAPPEQGMTDKNRERLRPFESEENIRKLVNLPEVIRRHIETAKSARARRKGLSTAALAIEILLVAPLRLSNLAALHLDRHFVKVGDGTHLVIPREMVKNAADLEFVLPSETIALIDWYLANHRKAEPDNRYLFAGAGMSHKTEGTLHTQIVGTVKAFLGLTVHPHLFRHIAASIYLRANPGSYEVVRLTLGHRRLTTTTAFYAGQEDKRARQHFAVTVRKLRNQQAIPPTRVRGIRSMPRQRFKQPADDGATQGVDDSPKTPTGRKPGARVNKKDRR